MISIILYTDFTLLSSKFTSTFRKTGPFEPIQAIIQRNRSYYWMSRFLKETEQVYGQYHSFGNGVLDPLRGPFYCGMSMIMKMPQFSMKLLSPTSTTVQISVACRGRGILYTWFRCELVVAIRWSRGGNVFIYFLYLLLFCLFC